MVAAALLLAGCYVGGRAPVAPTPGPTATSDLACGPIGDTEEATVTKIVDGDTIHVDIDGSPFRVRYIGLDAPEVAHDNNPGEPLGNEATEANRELVEGKRVILELDETNVDVFGRLLRYVWLPSDDNETCEMVNVLLAAEGMADVKEYSPDTRWQHELQTAEDQAKDANLGIWAN